MKTKPDRLAARVTLQTLWIDNFGVLTAKKEDGASMPLYSAVEVDRVLKTERARLRRVVRQRIREVERGSKCQENTSYKLALTDLLQVFTERL